MGRSSPTTVDERKMSKAWTSAHRSSTVPPNRAEAVGNPHSIGARPTNIDHD